MKKLLSIILLASVFGRANAYDGFGKKQPYSFALHVSNPIGILSKYGGGLEIRVRRVSLLANYYKYNGIYPGKQLSAELQFFLPSRNRHEFYLYAKGVDGDASYNGNTLGFLGYSTDISFPSQTYYGGGAGLGRRFNFGHLFLTLSAGVKYCAFQTAMPTDEGHMYNIFYYTGPGAYADLHLQFGIQL